MLAPILEYYIHVLHGPKANNKTEKVPANVPLPVPPLLVPPPLPGALQLSPEQHATDSPPGAEQAALAAQDIVILPLMTAVAQRSRVDE